MLEHDIPFVDSQDIKGRKYGSTLKSDYSTLALRMLANRGYLYRGNPLNTNMALNIPFGEVVMILVNSQLATLRQFNRTDDNQYFDDQNYKDVNNKGCSLWRRRFN